MNTYVESIVRSHDLPEFVVQQAFDMAMQAVAKAYEAGLATIELHADEEIRAIASALFIEMIYRDGAEKMTTAAGVLALVALKRSRADV